VALVSGANQGLGLEMAMALCEAGCRAVYCLDLAEEPSDEWRAAQEFLGRMSEGLEERRQGRSDKDNESEEPGMNVGRLEYISANVTDQELMWDVGKRIGDKEGRLDIGVAAAGIPSSHVDCLKYPAEQLRKVRISLRP
jgi:NAD(P)-dependent dehydrogenase (short-subunit alcohol dehydrogenase family)